MDEDHRLKRLLSFDATHIAKLGKAISTGVGSATGLNSLASENNGGSHSASGSFATWGQAYNNTNQFPSIPQVSGQVSTPGSTFGSFSGTSSAPGSTPGSAARPPHSPSEWDQRGFGDRSTVYDSHMQISCLAAAADGRTAAIAGKQHLHIVDMSQLSRFDQPAIPATQANSVASGGSLSRSQGSYHESDGPIDAEYIGADDATSQREIIKIKLEIQCRTTSLAWGHLATGGTVAVGSASDTVSLYTISGGEINRVHHLKGGHGRSITSISFSSSSGGNLLSAASSDGLLRIWDVRQGLKRVVLSMAKASDIAREAAFRPASEHKIASIYDSGLVLRWDLRRTNQADLRINAHIQGLTLDWHPTQNYLLTGGRDRRAHVWNMATDSRTPEHSVNTAGAVAQARWEQTEQQIANAGIFTTGRHGFYGEVVAYWSLRRPSIPAHCLVPHRDSIVGLSVVGPGLVWSAGRDGCVRQHDLRHEPLVWDAIPRSVSQLSARNEVACVFQSSQLPHVSARTKAETLPYHSQENAGDSEPAPLSMPFHMSLTPGTPAMEIKGTPMRQDVSSSFPGDNGKNQSGQMLMEKDVSSNHSAASPFNARAHIPGNPGAHLTPSQMTGSLSSDAMTSLRHVDQSIPLFRGGSLIFTDRPLFDHHSWCCLAAGYCFTQNESESLTEICIQNAKIARECSRLRTYQVWSMIAISVERANAKFIEALPANLREAATLYVKGALSSTYTVLRTPAHTKREHSDSRLSRFTASLRHSSDASLQSDQASIDDLKSDKERYLSKNNATAYNSETIRRHSHSTEQATTQANAWLSAKRDQQLSGVSFTSASDSVADADIHPQTHSSTEGKFGHNVNRQGRRASTPYDQSSLSMNYQETSRPNPFTNTPVQDRPVLLRSDSGFSQSLSKSMDSETADITENQHHSPLMLSLQQDYRSNSFNSETTKQPKAPQDYPSSQELLDTLDTSFRDFVRSQRSPWDLLPMVKAALQFALEDDTQLFATALLLLFCKFDSLLPKRQADDVIVSCVQLLRSRQCFVAAAQITSYSTAWADNVGVSDHSALTICHRCERPLSDNAAFMSRNTQSLGYWYCSHCRRQLDGCSYCNETVKGLAVVTVECGHRVHRHCWEEWTLELHMNECPSGCGQIIQR